MQTVGIMTTCYGNNFGEALQAFAVRRAIEKHVPDCRAELIGFVCKNQSELVKPGFERYREELEEKNRLFEEFRRNEIGLSGDPAHVLTAENAPLYDQYVFGSDQIWNTNAWKIPEFFGSFVPSGRKKVAYAASIGMKPDHPALDLELFQKYVGTFDFLSVREEVHCDFLRQFTEKDVHYVADPTLLLDMDTYRELLSRANPPAPDRKYIFYYQPHSADGAIVSLVNKLARIHRMDVVHTFADIPREIFPLDSVSARFAGPREFLRYISEASLVVTRSYHAVVFSILFGKPFYVYVDKKTGSRFESLLTTLGLEERMIYDYIKPEEVSLEIDYAKAYERLDRFRGESVRFLQAALEGKERT